jgi:ABC-2 type transport system ATP-binding protein
MSDNAIEIDGLTRTFRGAHGRPKVAVDDLGLDVVRGEMVGLLGPNGAGKTSTVKVLMTVLLPTAGQARVMGHDVVGEAHHVRRRIGVILGGDSGLYHRLSGRDNLLLFADLYGVPHRVQKRRVPELLDRVGLLGDERKLVETYSRGMKQRLHIARGLLHDPDVVVLDEPTNGIDPVGSRELRQMVRDQVADGRTVLLTTHYMFEADELCDRVAVMHRGRKIAEGTPEALKKQTDGQVVLTLDVRGAAPADIDGLRAIAGVQSVSVEENDGRQTIDVHTGQDQDLTATVLARLHDVAVLNVTKREPTLEDAYVSLIAGAGG